MSKNKPTNLWGTFSGPLILRKKALVLPDLPSQARCIVNGGDPTSIPIVAVEKGIPATELLSVLKYANKLFEVFELTGDSEFQASVAILARAFGISYKVVNDAAFHRESDWLNDSQLNELAYAAQDAEILHRLSDDIQFRTNGHALCYEKSEAIEAEAQTLGLVVQVSQSQSTVSRYLTISATDSDIAAMDVRISDHGAASATQCVRMRIQDTVDDVLMQLRRHFRTPSFDLYAQYSGC
jgi:fructose-specific phosphotransferase system component IIB